MVFKNVKDIDSDFSLTKLNIDNNFNSTQLNIDNNSTF